MQFHSVVETISMLLASCHSTSPFLAYLSPETFPFRFVLVYGLYLICFPMAISFQAFFTGLLLTPCIVIRLMQCYISKAIFIHISKCYAASAYITPLTWPNKTKYSEVIKALIMLMLFHQLEIPSRSRSLTNSQTNAFANTNCKP